MAPKTKKSNYSKEGELRSKIMKCIKDIIKKNPHSPDSHCSMCLEPMTNKAFSDSCFHTFCFKCIVQCANVTPECPVCKKPINSIIHNIQQDFFYDEYHLDSRLTDHWSGYTPIPTSQYSTTVTPLNLQDGNLEDNSSLRSSIELHRMRYAPHAVRVDHNPIIPCPPCPFRKKVYTLGLWVLPSQGVLENISPTLFQLHLEYTNRLLPWLNRELVAVLADDTHLTFVLEMILALITRYEITSEEFFILIDPYLCENTRHFVHELYNYAVSPLTMEEYDRSAKYPGHNDNFQFGVDNDVMIVDIKTPRNSTDGQTSDNVQKRSEVVIVPELNALLIPGPSTLPNFEVLEVGTPKETVDLSSDEDVSPSKLSVRKYWSVREASPKTSNLKRCASLSHLNDASSIGDNTNPDSSKSPKKYKLGSMNKKNSFDLSDKGQDSSQRKSPQKKNKNCIIF